MRSCSTLVTRLSSSVCLTAIALLGISVNAIAQDSGKLSSDDFFAAKIHGDAYNLSVGNAPQLAQSMRIAGPNGFSAESRSLSLSMSEPLADGLYKYEITGDLGWSNAVADAKANRENGRSEAAQPGRRTGVIATGYFRIVNGAVFEPGNLQEQKSSGRQAAESQ